MLKCKNNAKFREFIREVLAEFTNDKENRAITVNIDINPTVIR